MAEKVLRFADSDPRSSVLAMEKPASVSDVYRTHIEADAEFFDWEICSPEMIVGDFMDPAACIRAAEVCDLAYRKGAACPPTEDCVYIISNESRTACKIGLARNPGNRLATLQCGAWERLKFEGLFWSMETQAQALEFTALSDARDAGLSLRGEWFAATPHDLGMIVTRAACKRGIRLSSPSMFIRHRQMVRQTVKFLRKGTPPDGHVIILQDAA